MANAKLWTGRPATADLHGHLSSVIQLGFESRPHAWLAYQLWVTQVIQNHDDVGLKITVKILKDADGTWSFEAEVAHCSKD